MVSKGDLPIAEEDLARLPKDHLLVSVKSGLNMDVLRGRIETILLDLETFLNDRNDDELDRRSDSELQEEEDDESSEGLVDVSSFDDDSNDDN